MHPSYDDITSRIPEPPSWWQQGGVPRYGDFHPDASASIYATEVALVEIACQSCGTRFKVCFQASKISIEGCGGIEEKIVQGVLHYGDPPNTGCCPSGASMNSEPIRVLEYWHKNHQEFVENGRIIDWKQYSEWRRNPLLEGPIPG